MKLEVGFGTALLLAALPSVGQLSPQVRDIFVQGLGDIGEIKRQAELGDVSSQIKLADAYLSHNQSADALKWYAAAAAQKSAEGQYQMGRLLLFGRFGIPQEQRVAARPAEGLRWTYQAATSGHREAWRTMAQAEDRGVGCATNLAEAYAWLCLLADAGDIVGRVEMNSLALKLSSEEILHGRTMAQEMKAGRWPSLPAIRVPVTLKLNGIIISPKGNQAIINGHTMREGESAKAKIDGKVVGITCRSIQIDSVHVQIEGEDSPRVLSKMSK